MKYDRFNQLDHIHRRSVTATVRHHVRVNQLRLNFIGADGADDGAHFLFVTKKVPLVRYPIRCSKSGVCARRW